MILAAGLGKRLRPLSDLCAKPAMPVRGIPVIAHTLTWLARHDVNEVIVNLHHLPDTVRDSLERHRPDGVLIRYSEEPELLGTGGAMQAVADFLSDSDPSIVVAGDMLVDLDLSAAVARHQERQDAYTLLVRDGDPRAESFGTLGADAEDSLVRIGRRFDLGREVRRGLFMGIRIVSARCLGDWPEARSFEDLSDWLAPQLRAGRRDVRVDWIPCEASLWEPVGTTEEYLAVNLDPPRLSYRDEIPGEAQARVHPEELIVGSGAHMEPGAYLERVVIWPGERVPGDARARNGVWAGGRFVASEGPDSQTHPNGASDGRRPR